MFSPEPTGIGRTLHPSPVPVHALTPSKLLPARTRVFLDCLGDHIRIEGPEARNGDARATQSGAAHQGRRLRR